MLKCVRERKNKSGTHLPVVNLSFLSYLIGPRLTDEFESGLKRFNAFSTAEVDFVSS